MDPYLEVHWLDVHNSLVHLAKAQLQPQLGAELVARSEERIIVEDPLEMPRVIGPDVRVVESGTRGGPIAPQAGTAVVDGLAFEVETEPFPQRFIAIHDLTAKGRVVTIIEFLSPSNKYAGDGLEKYKQKQRECREAGVNLVEIDLTRSGRRELLVHRWTGARQHESTYQVSIWRAARPSRCVLHPIRLRDRLPAVQIPLRPDDRDVVLDLQALIGGVYETSGYDRTMDYAQPPEPPLEGDDAVWADEMLKRAGRR